MRIAATRHSAEEPAQPRVLDDQLGVDGEVPLEPVGDPDPLGSRVRDPAGLEPRLGPGVADLDAGLLEQPVVGVDHPARLAEALGVALVGDHLGLRDVQAHDLHQPRHRARAAPSGPRDEEHLPGVVGRFDVAAVERWSRRARAGQLTDRHSNARPRSILCRHVRSVAGRRSLSVVVPVFDVEAYLPETASTALLAQTHRELDVVVVDDGSTDGSGDDRRRRTPRATPGSGSSTSPTAGWAAPATRGCAHVRGELVAFADSDDVVPAGCVRRAAPADAAHRAPTS